MKYSFLFLVLFVLISCKSDDDSTNPIDQLPPATQTGANTFGCLINGEPFNTRGAPFGPPSKGASYQYVYDFTNQSSYYNFQVYGNNRETTIGVSINIIFSNYEDLQVGSYLLSIESAENIWGMGSYLKSGDVYDTSYLNTGYINIAYLDYENRIVSGTFEFNVDVNGDVYHVTDGRFDFNF